MPERPDNLGLPANATTILMAEIAKAEHALAIAEAEITRRRDMMARTETDIAHLDAQLQEGAAILAAHPERATADVYATFHSLKAEVDTLRESRLQAIGAIDKLDRNMQALRAHLDTLRDSLDVLPRAANDG